MTGYPTISPKLPAAFVTVYPTKEQKKKKMETKPSRDHSLLHRGEPKIQVQPRRQNSAAAARTIPATTATTSRAPAGLFAAAAAAVFSFAVHLPRVLFFFLLLLERDWIYLDPPRPKVVPTPQHAFQDLPRKGGWGEDGDIRTEGGMERQAQAEVGVGVGGGGGGELFGCITLTI